MVKPYIDKGKKKGYIARGYFGKGGIFMNKTTVFFLLSLVVAVCFFPAAAAGAVKVDLHGTTGLVLEWKDQQGEENGITGETILLDGEVNLDLKLTSTDQTNCFLSFLYQTGTAEVEV